MSEDEAQTPEARRDVAIVGAGTAGTAAALLLARAGHEVTLYERVPEPGPVGAGIVLQPTGQAVLARLGLLRPILEHGARIDRLRCATSSGRRVFTLEYGHRDRFGLGLHRGVLFETLLGAARQQPGLQLRCGADVRAPEPSGRGLVLRAADGERLGPHELLVVADGARSTLRSTCGVPSRVQPYPWGALWVVADDPEEVYASELQQIVRGTRRMLGLLPTGRGPTEDPTPQVSMFWSLRADQVDDFRRADLGQWKDEVRRYDPRAAFVLDAIDDPEQLLFAHYRHVTMQKWHGDRVVLLGDAAHAMSPQLGQGCNLALVDAAVLADALGQHARLEDALASYSRLRRAHLRYYQWATRWLTPFFQSDHGWLGWLRNLGMPLASVMPGLRGLMSASVAGHLRGVLRRPLDLAALAEGPRALPPG